MFYLVFEVVRMDFSKTAMYDHGISKVVKCIQGVN